MTPPHACRHDPLGRDRPGFAHPSPDAMTQHHAPRGPGGRRLRCGGARVRPPLHLEPLESRIVLAAGIVFDPRSGVLAIEGTPRNDIATVTLQGSRIVATLRTPSGSFSRAVSAAAVTRIDFKALAGDDSFTNSTHVMSVADGGSGDDTLIGGEGTDRFLGGSGKDRLQGRGGNDVLKGGIGDDWLDGGPGADKLGGGDGLDTLLGGEGADLLRGGSGGDLLDGGAGDDVLIGDEGDDQLYGGAGGDQIFGGVGDDKLWGGDGADALDGGAGNDTIDGDAGNDVLRGGDGIDHLLGGDGNDVLHGGGDDDDVDGEAGDDLLYGDGGDDRVDGGSGNDVLHGGDGHDELIGNHGDDVLNGDDGDDWLDGNEGRDIIRGGSGNDDCFDDDAMEDHSAEDEGDNLLAQGGRDVRAMQLGFDATGAAFVTGTSSSRRDRSHFSFVALPGGELDVTVYGDAPGRFAEVEVEEADGDRRTLLSLKPRSEETGTRRVVLVAGRQYRMWIRSQNMDPVDFVVALRVPGGVQEPSA